MSTSSVSARSQDPESAAPPAEVVISRDEEEAPVKSGRRRETVSPTRSGEESVNVSVMFDAT